MAHNVNGTRRTLDVKISEDISFDRMFLSTCTLTGLNSAGFFRPSPVQLQGIPLGKCGFVIDLRTMMKCLTNKHRNTGICCLKLKSGAILILQTKKKKIGCPGIYLLVEAKSGTGKTLVFGVTALELLDLLEHTQVLILAPTREIAAQITDVLLQIGTFYEGLKVEMVIGGLSVKDDFKKFTTCQRIQIVVGTPGRMRHLVELGYVDVSKIKLIVLDEADKLMEQSFQKDVNFVFNSLPVATQVIMCSATYPEKLKEFALNYLKHPQHICPNTTNILLGISQKILVVESHSNVMKQTENKFKELIRILTSIKFKQCLIFCNFQARVTEISKKLRKAKWPVETLYGCQEQNERLEALKTLQKFECRILVSTDLASRGLDAANVDLVINFEPPCKWTTYLHRIGRAGRFGSYGTSVTILAKGSETKNFKQALSVLKSHLELEFYDNSEQFEIDESVANPSKNTQDTQKINGYHDPTYLYQDPDASFKNGNHNLFDSDSEAIQNTMKEVWFKDKSLDKKLQVEQFNTLFTSYQKFTDEPNGIEQKNLTKENGNNHNITNGLVEITSSFKSEMGGNEANTYSFENKKPSTVTKSKKKNFKVDTLDTGEASTSKVTNSLKTRRYAQNVSDNDHNENGLNFKHQRDSINSSNTSSDNEDSFSPFPYYYKKYNAYNISNNSKKKLNTDKNAISHVNYKVNTNVDSVALEGCNIYNSDIENKYQKLVNEKSKYDPDIERKYKKIVCDSLNYYYNKTAKVAQSTCDCSHVRIEKNGNEYDDIVNRDLLLALPTASSYESWYKHLKARSKQIQMSVYISELSKLKNYY